MYVQVMTVQNHCGNLCFDGKKKCCDPKWITLPSSFKVGLTLTLKKKRINSGIEQKIGEITAAAASRIRTNLNYANRAHAFFVLFLSNIFQMRQGTNSIHIATSI